MPSASERIKALQAKQAAERAAREAAEQQAAAGQRERQRVEDEHQRKLQHSREVADRVLRESGVLAEVQAIKRDHIDGRFPKSALVTKYRINEENVTLELTLAWGEAFRIKDGNITYETGWFGAYPHVIDYNYILVSVNSESQTIAINYEMVAKDETQNVLTRAFLNPRREQYKFVRSGSNNFPVDSSHFNSPGG